MAPETAAANPTLVILAGPNGAGKTTLAPFLLRDAAGVREYVNADEIAKGLGGFSTETTAFAAGRLMLARMRELAAARQTFAFETTLATRSYARWLSDRKREGYVVGLVFLSLPSPDMAVERVRRRVGEGGHDVPEAIIRRRFVRGLVNLMNEYVALADKWWIYDGLDRVPRLVARRLPDENASIIDTEYWGMLKGLVTHGR
ncbi:MAG: zeta toxin family protein [Phycisphaerales bacterium]